MLSGYQLMLYVAAAQIDRHDAVELPRGPVYRFSLNHVVIPDDPYEMFPTEILEI